MVASYTCTDLGVVAQACRIWPKISLRRLQTQSRQHAYARTTGRSAASEAGTAHVSLRNSCKVSGFHLPTVPLLERALP